MVGSKRQTAETSTVILISAGLGTRTSPQPQTLALREYSKLWQQYLVLNVHVVESYTKGHQASDLKPQTLGLVNPTK